MKTPLEYAKFYVAKNIPVIPIKYKDKTPAIPSWKEYQDRLPGDDELQAWFGDNGNHNLAIVTGRLSGLVAVDLDSQKAVEFAKSKNFPETPLSKTERGYHAIYRYKEGVRNFQKRDDLPDIDLRGEGGYIVVEPSIHPSGHKYRWVKGKGLDDIPLAELPEAILAKKNWDKTSLKELYKGVPSGSRNDTLARLTGSWVNDGLSLQECLDMAFTWNSRNQPRMDNKEIERTVKSIYGRHLQQVPNSSTLSTSTQEKKIPQVEALLGIATKFVLFHDQNKAPYAFIDKTAIPLSATKLKNYLSYQYYQTERKAPNSDALNQVLNVLNGKALFESSQITLYNRIAEQKGVFWYDLVDGRAVKITPEGWEVTTDVPILFRRYSHQQRQVEPVDGSAWDVFKFLNVDDSHHLLVLVYLISCFVPDIPHPIFHPHGQHGAGKTTFCNVLKLLIDPSSISAIITPRDATQLIQVLSHHHICLFDNMSDLPAWMSDILAQACTGGGFQKRQLFTDEEDVIFQIKRCIGLNGINLLISKSDLMDRSILLHLERIDPSKRREEKELWAAFEKAKAGILGGIFSTLSKAMAIFPTIQPKALPRMADFAKWGIAITAALGKKPEDFIAAYESNIKRQNEEVIQNSTLAMSVLRLLGDKSEWAGTIKQAYKELFSLADNPARTDNSFPKSERSLKKFLNRIKTNLSDKGITFFVGDRTADGIPITFTSKDHDVDVDNVDEFGTCWKPIDLDSLLIGAEVVQ